MRALHRTLLCLATCAVVLPATHASAQGTDRQLPRSLVTAALVEPQPTAFAPADFSVEDFSVDRAEGGDAATHAQLEAETLEWVRVARVVVLPRAVLQVRVPGATRGSVQYAGAAHPMTVQDGVLSADVPVVLIAGRKYPIVATVERGGALHTTTFHVRFSPRPEHAGLVLFDSSCSPYGLWRRRGSIPRDAFMLVGCSMVITLRDERDSPSLDLYVLFEGAGDDVRVEGIPTPPTVDTLWQQRVTNTPNASTFSARGERAELSWMLPERLYPGFLGVGLGPYYYAYEDRDTQLWSMIPLLTLYAGYTISPTMRVVYFNAAALHGHGFMDQGAYLWLEQLRMLDDRVSLNLLLGANVLVYSHDEKFTARLSAPQGFELVFRDFFATSRNLTFGAFLYPKIAGRTYYNTWIRWGSGAFFGEVNYIGWKEPHDNGYTETHSLGLSFGIPVWRYLRFL
jgi:hypothetical protein